MMSGGVKADEAGKKRLIKLFKITATLLFELFYKKMIWLKVLKMVLKEAYAKLMEESVSIVTRSLTFRILSPPLIF